MDELKKCPFCGGDAAMLRMGGLKKIYFNSTVKRPTCMKCGATIFVWFSEDVAVRAWNRRAGEEEQDVCTDAH